MATRKEQLCDEAIKILNKAGVSFTSHNKGFHLIVEGKDSFIDFWPSTGKWIIRITKQNGFGVKKLLEEL